LFETNQKGLFLLPASTALTSIDRCPNGADAMGLVLKNALALVSKTFDLVIVDGPPMAGVLLVNAVLAAQQLIIPTQTEFLAVQGLSRMLSTLDHINQSLLKLNSESDSDAQPISLPPYLIVPTMHDRRTQASMLALKSLREQYDKRVWGSQIATDTKLRDAMAAAVLPHKTSDESSAVNCYRALYEDLNKFAPGDAVTIEQQFQG
jgi:chromosome partitioning protein